jgi:hypothetical protein
MGLPKGAPTCSKDEAVITAPTWRFDRWLALVLLTAFSIGSFGCNQKLPDDKWHGTAARLKEMGRFIQQLHSSGVSIQQLGSVDDLLTACIDKEKMNDLAAVKRSYLEDEWGDPYVWMSSSTATKEHVIVISSQGRHKAVHDVRSSPLLRAILSPNGDLSVEVLSTYYLPR